MMFQRLFSRIPYEPTEPTESTEVTKPTFTVKGNVEPADVEVRVNGEPVTTNSDGSFDALVDLQQGENEVSITAINGSKQDEYARVITREPSEEELAQQEAAQQEAAQQEAAQQEAAQQEAAQQEAAQQEAAQQEAAQSEEAQSDTVAVGQPLALEDVAWLVTDATTATQLSQEEFGELGETKQGNFVVVDFDFTNNTNEALTLDSASLTLIDSDGRESEPDTDTFGYVPQNLDPFLKQVNPGVTESGRVIFTVAPDASGFKLRLGDAQFFSGEEGFVNLGF